jgi:serine/threonine protein kinase
MRNSFDIWFESSGYQPPEYIERGEISKKFDIFSLGVVMIKIVCGPKGYIKRSYMDPEEFVNQVRTGFHYQDKWFY